MLKKCTTKELCSVVRLLWAKGLNTKWYSQRNVSSLRWEVFVVQSASTLVANVSWWRRSWIGGAEVAETTVKRLVCCGFRSTGKAVGHVCLCWWICRECFFFQVRILHVLRLLSICDFSTESPSYFILLMLFSATPSLCSFLNVRDEVSHPCKAFLSEAFVNKLLIQLSSRVKTDKMMSKYVNVINN
jgi:hypothetical protein